MIFFICFQYIFDRTTTPEFSNVRLVLNCGWLQTERENFCFQTKIPKCFVEVGENGYIATEFEITLQPISNALG